MRCGCEQRHGNKQWLRTAMASDPNGFGSQRLRIPSNPKRLRIPAPSDPSSIGSQTALDPSFRTFRCACEESFPSLQRHATTASPAERRRRFAQTRPHGHTAHAGRARKATRAARPRLIQEGFEATAVRDPRGVGCERDPDPMLQP